MRKLIFLGLILFSIQAFGQIDGVPIDSLNPQKNLNFDTTCTGFSAFRAVALKNTGNSTITLDSVQVPPPFFFDYLVSTTLNPGDTTTLGIRFFTTTPGAFSDSLSVFSSNNNPNPYRFALVGVSFPTPNAEFDITSDTIQCLGGNRFTFQNKSTIAGNGPIAFEWIFGDGGSTDTSTNPTYSYAFADTFDILLIATAARGCATVEEKRVYVLPTPAVDFSVNSNTLCINSQPFRFTSNVSISSGTFDHLWNFGDGTTSTSKDPEKTYSLDSIFSVKLKSTSNLGCADSVSKQITVLSKPTVAFSVNDTDQCLAGNQFVFTQNSLIKSGTLSYFWTFGDNTSSTQAAPVKVYTSAGRFPVRLRVQSQAGCSDSLTLDVNVFNMPNIQFRANDSTQCLVGNLFAFNNTSNVTGGTLTYQWNFGDGNTSTDANPQHTFANAAGYTVKLTATSNNGCIDSLAKPMIVFDMPEAAFSVNDQGQCLASNEFIFSNQSQGASNYFWDFGDNTTFIGVDTTFTYSRADSFNVLMIAVSQELCADSTNMWVYVNHDPSVDFNRNFTAKCAVGNLFEFTNRSSISEGNLSHLWNFGDGNTSNAENGVHQYAPVAGVYDVKLISTSDSGCADSMIKPVRLWASPDAAFSINDADQCVKGNLFQFTNNSTVSEGALTYEWDFGNGNKSTNQNPTQTFNIAGIFNITLIAVSDSGCRDTVVTPVNLFDDPIANFTVNNESQCLPGNNFIFTNTSTILTGNLSANWNFGDGSPAGTSFNAIHTYAGADTFFVILVVNSSDGCADTVIRPVFVNPVPVASFSINNNAQCRLGNNFAFLSTTQLPNWNFADNWTFGDGAVGTGQSVNHSYVDPGDFIVKLVSRTSVGCADSITRTITVHPQPIANFAPNNDRQCYNNHRFQFNNTSVIASGNLNNLWYFGDGTTSTEMSPSKIFPFPDTFRVSLVVTSDFGCKDSIMKLMYVYPDPTAEFIIDDTSQCIRGNVFNFFNQSSVPGGGPMVFNWRFGDGGGSVAESPTHTYRISDTFQVRLIVITGGGICADTAFRTAIVTPLPNATFTGLRPQECLNAPPIELRPLQPGGFFYGDNVVGNFFNPIQLGSNKVFYTNELNGCVDTTMFETIIITGPQIDLGPDTNLCVGEQIGFNVTTPFATYLWSTGSTSPRLIVTSPGIYSVTVSNICGTVTDLVEIRYFDFACDAFVPNAFTPDGNTVNDVFRPFISGNVDAIDFRIYNRWGNEVFQTYDRDKGWDGTFQGKPAQPDVYAWSLNYTVTLDGVRNLRSLRGNVTLIR